jgi:hypothetical protein
MERSEKGKRARKESGLVDSIRRKSPEQYQKAIMEPTPRMLQTYHASYNGCLKVFKPETCRK